MRHHHPLQHLPILKPHKHSLKTVRNLPLAHHQPALTLHQPSSLILPLGLLPLNAELTIKASPLEIALTKTHLTLKKGSEITSVSIKPNQQWVQVALNQPYKTVFVSTNPPQSLPQGKIYDSLESWKEAEGKTEGELMSVSVETLLNQLFKNNKKHRTLEGGTRNSISGFMRAKFSERQKLPYRKSQNVSQRDVVSNIALRPPTSMIHTALQKQGGREGLVTAKRWGRRGDSNDEKNQLMDRETTTTSSSIVNDSNQLRFSKKIKKITNFLEHRRDQSDSSAVFATAQVRPKFYEQVNISQEQFNLKRKKFDSQCVIKIERTSLNELPANNCQASQAGPENQPNESSVTEEIAQMEHSKGGCLMEDTLERGFQAQQPGKPEDESGSLYQSVFE